MKRHDRSHRPLPCAPLRSCIARSACATHLLCGFTSDIRALSPGVLGAHGCSASRSTCHVRYHPAAPRPRAAMALLSLSGDEQRILFVQLCNVLEPRTAVYLSSTCNELRTATEALLQQLRTEHEAASALCRKVGLRSCKELCEAKKVDWRNKGLSSADLAFWARWARCYQRSRRWSSSNAQAQLAPTACSGWRRGWARARCRP
eukprot:scaffold49912_cov66-Phaeocystis_antarctica.AAC.5